jgi:hypothetical protein
MKKIAAALLMSFSFAGAPVLAQTAAAPQAASAPVDPAAAAAVRELFKAMDYRNVMLASLKQMSAAMPAAIRGGAEAGLRNDPKLNDTQRAQKLAELDEKLPKMTAKLSELFSDPALIDEMLAEMVPIYARYFSVEETRQLAAFYKTPVGIKTLQLMPQLMNEGMQMGQKVMMPRMQKLMQELK